jgi:hypothetical protein
MAGCSQAEVAVISFLEFVHLLQDIKDLIELAFAFGPRALFTEIVWYGDRGRSK